MSSKMASTDEPDVKMQLQDALRDLERYASELERSNRDLEQFAYAASHDLQTPLRKVNSFSRLLRDELEPLLPILESEKRDRIVKYLDFVIAGADKSHELINGLLSFSRIGRRLDRKLITIDTSLDDAIFILDDDVRAKGVAISRSSLPIVYADASLMARVFQNLVGNAIKFRHDDRPPRIWIEAKERSDDWLFSVRDNGIGIDERHQDRVFVIFQRIGNKKAGTGLGLALCKKIVESHGGQIWFESVLGEGTTFYFTLSKESEDDKRVDASEETS